MKSLNKIACFLMLCWMVVIFMFSAEPDTESSELSGSVSYRIVSVVNTITASHQLFVPGRAGRFTDVAIDTAGGIIMLLFIALVTHVARKKHTAGTVKPKI